MIYLNFISNGVRRYFYEDFENYYPTGDTIQRLESGYHFLYGGRRIISITTGIITGYIDYFYDHFENYASGGITYTNSGVVTGYHYSHPGLTGYFSTYHIFAGEDFESYVVGSVPDATAFFSGSAMSGASLHSGFVLAIP